MYQQVKASVNWNYKIIVTNVKSGESLCYSLALLKGCISCDNSQECLNNNVQNVITVRHYVDSTEQETEWPVVDYQFKCVVNLNRGANEIILKYVNVQQICKLEFKPRRTAYRVMPVYIICRGHNGRFHAPETEENSVQSACKRIAVGAKVIQCVAAEKLHEAGFCRKAFQLENDLNSQAAECTVFYSRLHVDAARKMKPGDLWEYFARELMTSSLGNADRKFLAFLSCTYYKKCEEKPQSHEKMLAQLEAHVALGGGGLAIFGTACLHTWPQDIKEILPRFLNTTIVDSRYFMDDSCYRGTYGACFATTLGSVCHELGHTFDLGHTETGIMGRGFDNINLVFTLQPKRNRIESTGRGLCGNRGGADKGDVRQATVCFTKVLSLSYSVQGATKPGTKNRGDDKMARLLRNGGQEIAPVIKCDEYSTTRDSLDSDMTYWGTSCATLLAFHRWFNTEVPRSGSGKISFDETRNAVSSDAGLSVVELRDGTGLVRGSWQFPGAPRTSVFRVPAREPLPATLVAQDRVGNILKQHLGPAGPTSA
ncbi:uncharacterized protein LOC134539997 [Bacillus rossius redtenbacheri]|uniref:uncharacterized protein LOC134539997 n=1 Tax=Bacillus rossius redtenbacheri TaxID=93214 RepID=UPI002FDCE519